MRDFPDNNDDDDGNEGAGNAMILHLDDDGLPCFNCFFGALYDMLPHLPVESEMQELRLDIDTDDVEFLAHFVTTSAALAERYMSLADEQFGDSGVTMVEGFIEYLQRMVAKRIREENGPLN